MKRTLTVVFATLLLSLAGLTAHALGRVQAGNSINTISRQYSAINKRARAYKKIKKELLGFSTEGGELLAYLDGPTIVKIVANHYGEMGRSVEEFYYQNGKLIFVFDKLIKYDKPFSGKIVGTAENRFYFSNDNLIRWIGENGKQIDNAGEEFRSKQKDILENSNRFTAAARSRNPIIER